MPNEITEQEQGASNVVATQEQRASNSTLDLVLTPEFLRGLNQTDIFPQIPATEKIELDFSSIKEHLVVNPLQCTAETLVETGIFNTEKYLKEIGTAWKTLSKREILMLNFPEFRPHVFSMVKTMDANTLRYLNFLKVMSKVPYVFSTLESYKEIHQALEGKSDEQTRQLLSVAGALAELGMRNNIAGWFGTQYISPLVITTAALAGITLSPVTASVLGFAGGWYIAQYGGEPLIKMARRRLIKNLDLMAPPSTPQQGPTKPGKPVEFTNTLGTNSYGLAFESTSSAHQNDKIPGIADPTPSTIVAPLPEFPAMSVTAQPAEIIIATDPSVFASKPVSDTLPPLLATGVRINPLDIRDQVYGSLDFAQRFRTSGTSYQFLPAGMSAGFELSYEGGKTHWSVKIGTSNPQHVPFLAILPFVPAIGRELFGSEINKAIGKFHDKIKGRTDINTNVLTYGISEKNLLAGVEAAVLAESFNIGNDQNKANAIKALHKAVKSDLPYEQIDALLTDRQKLTEWYNQRAKQEWTEAVAGYNNAIAKGDLGNAAYCLNTLRLINPNAPGLDAMGTQISVQQLLAQQDLSRAAEVTLAGARQCNELAQKLQREGNNSHDIEFLKEKSAGFAQTRVAIISKQLETLAKDDPKRSEVFAEYEHSVRQVHATLPKDQSQAFDVDRHLATKAEECGLLIAHEKWQGIYSKSKSWADLQQVLSTLPDDQQPEKRSALIEDFTHKNPDHTQAQQMLARMRSAKAAKEVIESQTSVQELLSNEQHDKALLVAAIGKQQCLKLEQELERAGASAEELDQCKGAALNFTKTQANVLYKKLATINDEASKSSIFHEYEKSVQDLQKAMPQESLSLERHLASKAQELGLDNVNQRWQRIYSKSNAWDDLQSVLYTLPSDQFLEQGKPLVEVFSSKNPDHPQAKQALTRMKCWQTDKNNSCTLDEAKQLAADMEKVYETSGKTFSDLNILARMLYRSRNVEAGKLVIHDYVEKQRPQDYKELAILAAFSEAFGDRQTVIDMLNPVVGKQDCPEDLQNRYNVLVRQSWSGIHQQVNEVSRNVDTSFRVGGALYRLGYNYWCKSPPPPSSSLKPGSVP